VTLVAAALVLAVLAVAPAAGEAQAADRAATAAPPEDALAREIARLQAEVAALRAALTDPAAAGRIAAVERDLARVLAELRALREDQRRTAGDVDALSQGASRRNTVTVYGDFQVRSTPGAGLLFDGRALELVVSGRPHRRLALFGEVEFEQGAGVGAARGGEIVVEQAWASLEIAPMLHVRPGILVVPFGNVNVDHFAPRRDVVSKPLSSYVVAPSDWTDNGIALGGRRLLGSRLLVSYEACLVAGLGREVTGRGMRGARQGYGVDNNRDRAAAGRVSVARGDALQVGLSGYRGRYDDEGRRMLRGWAVDGAARLSRFRVTGEWNAFEADRGTEPAARLRGYYVRLSADVGALGLARIPVLRDFDDPRVTLIAQYDAARVEGPVGPAFERNRERRVTAGVNLRPTSEWVLKLSYEWSQSDGEPLVNGDRDGFVGAVSFVF
jgi:hypothetical protein